MTIEEFFDKIKDIPNRCSGGCLLFCYLFYLQFKNIEIVQYDYPDGISIKRNIAFLNNERAQAYSSAHFTWIYQNQEYDANGVYNYQRDREWLSVPQRIVLPLNERLEEFCISALNHGSWNSMFYRKAAIAVIEERFGFDLSRIR